jgi:hypothetical protein
MFHSCNTDAIMTDSVLKSTLLSILFTPARKFEYVTVLIQIQVWWHMTP